MSPARSNHRLAGLARTPPRAVGGLLQGGRRTFRCCREPAKPLPALPPRPAAEESLFLECYSRAVASLADACCPAFPATTGRGNHKRESAASIRRLPES